LVPSKTKARWNQVLATSNAVAPVALLVFSKASSEWFTFTPAWIAPAPLPSSPATVFTVPAATDDTLIHAEIVNGCAVPPELRRPRDWAELPASAETSCKLRPLVKVIARLAVPVRSVV
jgi:hypothetical protein